MKASFARQFWLLSRRSVLGTLRDPGTMIPGLTVLVTGTATGDLGNVTYTPGVAARMVFVSANATDALSGAFTAEPAGERERYPSRADVRAVAGRDDPSVRLQRARERLRRLRRAEVRHH